MNIWRKLQIKINNRWNDYNFKRIFLLIIFWLSIFGLFISLELSSFLSKINNDLTEIKYIWIIILFLPIPILSIILGVKYKRRGYRCKKNIIAGIIMTFIYIMFAWWFNVFYFTEKDNISNDYSYLVNLEEKINFHFPDEGEIFTSKLAPLKTSSYQMIANSVVSFKDKEEIKDLEERIKISSIWTNNNTSYLKMLEPIFYTETDNPNNYYLIYIEDLGLFNTAPIISGTYKTYCLVYDIEDDDLDIYEYYLFFSL